MLDIKFIRENADIVKDAARKKHVNVDIDLLLKKDDERRDLMQKADVLRAEQNNMSGNIAREQNADARAQMIIEMTTVKNDLGKIEEDLKPIMLEWKKLMLEVPNVPDMSVPEGAGDADNVEIKVVGEKPVFTFKPKDHIELWPRLFCLDLSEKELACNTHSFH
jgi:seryl-tRNA synthetase